MSKAQANTGSNNRWNEYKAEADRLACTGSYKKAAAMYRNLGLDAQADHYEAQQAIKDRG